MSGYATLGEAIEYVQAARLATHQGACPSGRNPHVDFPCMACPSFMATAHVLDIIRANDAKPTAVRPARLFLHDRACASGCEGDQREEHSRRHDCIVREIRRYVKGK